MNDHYFKSWLKKSVSLLIILTACAVVVRAQQEPSLPFVVNGIVKDASNGRPLKSVNISIPGTHISTVTNEEGTFSIKAPERPKRLRFSHIGYQTTLRNVPENAKSMTVKIIPNTVVLNDVIVMMDDPEKIVKIAINKIPDNYSLSAEQDRCFYRETAQKRKKFIYIAEAVTDMYKTGYNRDINADRVAIHRGRRIVSPKLSDTLSVKVIGGPVQATILDVVKNRPFLLCDEELYFYNMKMEQPVRIDDRPQYVISISPRYRTDYALYYGQLFIDKETLSFTRISLQLDMSNIDNATRAMLVRKPVGVKFRPKELSLLVNYTYDEGVSRLSYLSTVFRFNCDWKKHLFATSFTAINEMVVTDRHLSGFTPIRRKDSFSERESLYDQQTNFSDDNFWKDYNIIEPTETLEKAINRIIKAK